MITRIHRQCVRILWYIRNINEYPKKNEFMHHWHNIFGALSKHKICKNLHINLCISRIRQPSYLIPPTKLSANQCCRAYFTWWTNVWCIWFWIVWMPSYATAVAGLLMWNWCMHASVDSLFSLVSGGEGGVWFWVPVLSEYIIAFSTCCPLCVDVCKARRMFSRWRSNVTTRVQALSDAHVKCLHVVNFLDASVCVSACLPRVILI